MFARRGSERLCRARRRDRAKRRCDRLRQQVKTGSGLAWGYLGLHYGRRRDSGILRSVATCCRFASPNVRFRFRQQLPVLCTCTLARGFGVVKFGAGHIRSAAVPVPVGFRVPRRPCGDRGAPECPGATGRLRAVASPAAETRRWAPAPAPAATHAGRAGGAGRRPRASCRGRGRLPCQVEGPGRFWLAGPGGRPGAMPPAVRA